MRGTTGAFAARRRLAALVVGGSTATAALFLAGAPTASATHVSPPTSFAAAVANALTMTADTADPDVVIVDPSLWQKVANIASTSLQNAQANGSLEDALATQQMLTSCLGAWSAHGEPGIGGALSACTNELDSIDASIGPRLLAALEYDPPTGAPPMTSAQPDLSETPTEPPGENAAPVDESTATEDPEAPGEASAPPAATDSTAPQYETSPEGPSTPAGATTAPQETTVEPMTPSPEAPASGAAELSPETGAGIGTETEGHDETGVHDGTETLDGTESLDGTETPDGTETLDETRPSDGTDPHDEEAGAAQDGPAPAPQPKTWNRPGSRAFVAPSSGTITSPFGDGRDHGGIDIANTLGAPIVAVADGEVINAGPAQGYGLWVRIRHDDGTITTYGHNNDNLVEVGQRVKAGQKIATIGNRGNSTGPHLHFEVETPDGDKTDPLAWLTKRGASIIGLD